ITKPAGPLAEKFRGAPEKSEEQQRLYQQLAAEPGVPFFSMAEVADPSPIDGIHLDEAGQAALGEAMAPRVAEVLGLNCPRLFVDDVAYCAGGQGAGAGSLERQVRLDGLQFDLIHEVEARQRVDLVQAAEVAIAAAVVENNFGPLRADAPDP